MAVLGQTAIAGGGAVVVMAVVLQNVIDAETVEAVVVQAFGGGAGWHAACDHKGSVEVNKNNYSINFDQFH